MCHYFSALHGFSHHLVHELRQLNLSPLSQHNQDLSLLQCYPHRMQMELLLLQQVQGVDPNQKAKKVLLYSSVTFKTYSRDWEVSIYYGVQLLCCSRQDYTLFLQNASSRFVQQNILCLVKYISNG